MKEKLDFTSTMTIGAKIAVLRLKSSPIERVDIVVRISAAR